MSTTTHDINCPNCGAPTEIPVMGNSVVCPYCGTRYYLPQTLIGQPPPAEVAPAQEWDPQQKKRIVRWIWIIVGITLAVTIIPTVCSLVITFCVSLFTVLASLPR